MNLIETLLQTIITKQDQILAQLNSPTNSQKCGQNTTKKTSIQKDASFKPPVLYERQHFDIANQMYEIINATTKTRKPNMGYWANDIRKLNLIDKIPIDKILLVFKVANKDEFWSMNVRSPKKLRQHWDRLNLLRRKSLGLNSKGEDKRESLDYFKEKQW